MKRFREGTDTLDFNLAQVLMLLSQQQHAGAADADAAAGQPAAPGVDSDATGRVFECKTCNRQFPSFQALGGHRASHKKPRLVVDADGQLVPLQYNSRPAAKPRTHECSICGVEFALGQALGGHMRRHRGAGAAAGGAGLGGTSEDDDHVIDNHIHKHGQEEQPQGMIIHPPAVAEVSKKKTIAYYGGASSARVQLSSAFDLNVPPQPETNQLAIHDPLELTLRCTVSLDLLPSLVH